MFRRFFTKKELHGHQKPLLRTLYQATDWVGADEIAAAINITRRALTGVMGGLGTRAGGVRGWPQRKHTGVRPTRWLWEHERRRGEDFYLLTPEFRQAIAAANII
jgi:hypothetical protein